MVLQAVLPFLIPGLLFQLCMQVCYIARSVRGRGQKSAHRALYILTIALFGLPAIAFHLFRTRKTPPRDAAFDEVERAASFTLKGTFILLAIAYQVMGLHMLAENIGTPTYTPLITLLTASFLIMLLYNTLSQGKRLATGPLLPILQLALCVPIQFMDRSGDNLFLSIIAGFGAINHAPLPGAKVYGIGALGAYLLGSTAKTVFLSGASEMSQLVRYFFVNALVVLLALVAFYTLKKQIITGIQLEYALNTVKEQAERLKGLAVANERNRIAAEMHDTVGHTLTAAVLTLETAEELQDRQPQAAVQRLRQGKEQVRRALAELRASVRAVRAEGPLDFATALEQLLEKIRADTGLDIHSIHESQINLSPLQAGILLSAVKECATNAVRHGRASRADILIGAHQGQMRLAFTDNGVGATHWQPGSGLGIMRERVQGIGGTMMTETAPGEGFTISLSIPAAQREEAP